MFSTLLCDLAINAKMPGTNNMQIKYINLSPQECGECHEKCQSDLLVVIAQSGYGDVRFLFVAVSSYHAILHVGRGHRNALI